MGVSTALGDFWNDEAMVCKSIVALFLAFSLSHVLIGMEIEQDKSIQNQLGAEEINGKLGLNSDEEPFESTNWVHKFLGEGESNETGLAERRGHCIRRNHFCGWANKRWRGRCCGRREKCVRVCKNRMTCIYF